MRGNTGCSMRRSGLFGAVALALVAAGCAPPTPQPDVREAHSLRVEPKTFSLTVRLAPSGGASTIQDEDRLQLFVQDYLRRGRSPLMVATPPDDEEEAARARAVAVRARLVAAGVRPGDVVLNRGMVPPGIERAVVLSFRGYDVAVPECADWSGTTGYNPSNLPHTNFGCSYQRNLGLMLSDPGDLLKTGPLGARDAARGDDVLKKYRAGKPTEAEAPKQEKGTVQISQ